MAACHPPEDVLPLAVPSASSQPAAPVEQWRRQQGGEAGTEGAIRRSGPTSQEPTPVRRRFQPIQAAPPGARRSGHVSAAPGHVILGTEPTTRGSSVLPSRARYPVLGASDARSMRHFGRLSPPGLPSLGLCARPESDPCFLSWVTGVVRTLRVYRLHEAPPVGGSVGRRTPGGSRQKSHRHSGRSRVSTASEDRHRRRPEGKRRTRAAHAGWWLKQRRNRAKGAF